MAAGASHQMLQEVQEAVVEESHQMLQEVQEAVAEERHQMLRRVQMRDQVDLKEKEEVVKLFLVHLGWRMTHLVFLALGFPI